MPITIVATAGAADANSYVTVAEAEAYLAARFGGSPFVDADDEDQKIALVQATNEIDRNRFHGRKNAITQALEFPRAYPYVEESAPTSVPRKVKLATFEHALYLLVNKATGGANRRQKLQAEGVQAFSVGDMSETFVAGGGGAGMEQALCPEARTLLRGWIDRTGRITVTGREEAWETGEAWNP